MTSASSFTALRTRISALRRSRICPRHSSRARRPWLVRLTSLARPRQAPSRARSGLLGTETAVQRDDAAREVPEGDLLPADGAQPATQRDLVRPVRDRLREVLVGAVLARDGLRDLGERLHEVLLVDLAEGPPGGRRELADHDA